MAPKPSQLTRIQSLASVLKFHRFDLVDSVSACLRDCIQRGALGPLLPGERDIAQAVGVSRTTLRAALSQLEAEGIICRTGKQGERKVVPQRLKRPVSLRVRLLQDGRPYCYFNEYLYLLRQISFIMRSEEAFFSIETQLSCYSGRPGHALEKLVQSHPADLWILHRSSPAMQAWFLKRRIPFFLLGSAPEDRDLPCLDVDYASIGHHASGTLLARGHRALAVLHPASMRRGDQFGLDAFAKGVHSSSHPDATVECQAFGPSVKEICKAVDRLLDMEKRPEGWLVFTADACFTVYTHIARRGIQIGREISLICRNADPAFTRFNPSVAHYERDAQQLKDHLRTLLNRLLRNKPLPRKKFLIEAHFRDGESLRASGGQV